MNDRHQRLLKLLSDIEQQIAEAESFTVEPGDDQVLTRLQRLSSFC